MGIDAGVIPEAEGQGTMAISFIYGDDLMQMLPSQSQLSLDAERLPQGAVGFHEQRGVILTIGQIGELLPEFARRLQVRPHVRRPPQSKEDREEQLSSAQVLTQLARP